jgi:hypothetical protein
VPHCGSQEKLPKKAKRTPMVTSLNRNLEWGIMDENIYYIYRKGKFGRFCVIFELKVDTLERIFDLKVDT